MTRHVAYQHYPIPNEYVITICTIVLFIFIYFKLKINATVYNYARVPV